MYNRGLLSKELLTDLMWPYEEIDIDTGGMEGTLANDGLDIEEIVIRTFGKTFPRARIFRQIIENGLPNRKRFTARARRSG